MLLTSHKGEAHDDRQKMRMYLFFVLVTFFIAASNAQAGNDDVNGWGKFTWGMTQEEVMAIDPKWERSGLLLSTGSRDKIDLFGKKFWVGLHFKKSEGLHQVRLWTSIGLSSPPVSDQAGFVLQVFNALKAKYGQGSSIQYKYEEEGITYNTETGKPSLWGKNLSIKHIWRLKKTIIEYTGIAIGRVRSLALEPDASLYITYSAKSSSDYDKL